MCLLFFSHVVEKTYKVMFTWLQITQAIIIAGNPDPNKGMGDVLID
jgi:hypothetical protein